MTFETAEIPLNRRLSYLETIQRLVPQKDHEVYMFALYMCFGMTGLLSLCTGRVCPAQTGCNQGD